MPAPKKRNHRTPEQIVADMEAKIPEVKERVARKAAKQTPEGKAFVAARGAASRALKDALEEHANAAGLASARKGPKAA